MTGRVGWGAAATAVVAALGAAGVAPGPMLAPGPLIDAHADLAADCFACHVPLRGVSTEACTACHSVSDLGRRSTTGAPLDGATAFHQDLIEQDCVTCHSDHAGPRLTRRERKPFSHDLLRPAVRDACDTCHAAPDDRTHAAAGPQCGSCHGSTTWLPATFRHEVLAPEVLAACGECHQAPSDALHESAAECGSCHSQDAWSPATFDHREFFVLDRDHDASCATCHPARDLTTYTCYGCHAHSRASIAGEHWEEGIGDFRDCVECHRSGEGEEHGRRGGWEEEEDDD
ncbi:MAG: cytochrome c3 family protein [Myxococcota bacterium]